MNKKLSSYEKTELIYKQIIADEENEKAKDQATARLKAFSGIFRQL